MRWGTIGVGLLAAIVGLLLTVAAVLVTLHVYGEDGLLSWRVPGGVLFTLCALYMTWTHVQAWIAVWRAA